MNAKTFVGVGALLLFDASLWWIFKLDPNYLWTLASYALFFAVLPSVIMYANRTYCDIIKRSRCDRDLISEKIDLDTIRAGAQNYLRRNGDIGSSWPDNVDFLRILEKTSESRMHARISREVFQRLIMRHALLDDLTNLERKYLNQSSEAENSKSNCHYDCIFERDDNKRNHADTKTSGAFPRSYYLAITDLFVEKALAYLDKHASKYQLYGMISYSISFFLILAGVIASFNSMSKEISHSYLGAIYQIPGFVFASKEGAQVTRLLLWQDVLSQLMKSFTFYGMIVLMAVMVGRLGRAMLNQAERLFERRHALRQGRLFVHLNDGKVSVDELEKAFNWNAALTNAFADIPTEASAPLGAVVNKLTDALSDAFKATAKFGSIQASKSFRASD